MLDHSDNIELGPHTLQWAMNLGCTDSEPCISCAGTFVYGGNVTCREAATQLSITWRKGPAQASHVPVFNFQNDGRLESGLVRLLAIESIGE